MFDMIISQLSRALRESGFIMRGGFHPGPKDQLNDYWNGVATLIMVGNAGGDMWREFSQSPEYNANNRRKNPLDNWTRRSLLSIATRFHAKVIFPFDGPPYFPFQRWAQIADNVFPSPIGPLIHPEFGLWHAYRGAFLFYKKLSLPIKTQSSSPCNACSSKQCLSSCPVGAFSFEGFNRLKCVTYIETNEEKSCFSEGCGARRACPIGQSYQYNSAQAFFQQQQFLRSGIRY